MIISFEESGNYMFSYGKTYIALPKDLKKLKTPWRIKKLIGREYKRITLSD